MLYPSRICCFIAEDNTGNGDENLHAIIQPAFRLTGNMFDDYLFPIVQRRILRPKTYFYVDVQCIQKVCYAIPDIDDNGNDGQFVVVNSMDSWGEQFMDLNFDI